MREYMIVDYRPLWITCLVQKIQPAELRRRTGLSSATFTKLRHNEPVNLTVLLRCAEVLNVNVQGLVEFKWEVE